MKLLDKYSKFDVGYPSGLASYPLGFCRINVHIKDILLSNVKYIEFQSLYPNILSGIFLAGYKDSEVDDIKFEEYVRMFEFYRENKNNIRETSPTLYAKFKTDVNKFFGNVGIETQYKVSQYVRNYYNDILSSNEKIAYIDTDIIYYEDEIDLLGINIPYTKGEVPYIIFNDRKKYTSFDQFGKFKSFGEANIDKSRKFIENLKREIREDKLNKILQ